MSDISPSAIKTNRAIEERLEGTTNTEQIKEIMRDAALVQNLVHRDWDPSILQPVESGTGPCVFAKTVTVNGVKHILEASDEAGLLAQENSIYRAAMAQPAATVEPATQPRDKRGLFVSAEDAAAKSELELAFKRGDISASDYLQRSGAIDEYLEKAGVPLEELKASVQEKQGARFTQSWADATENFLRSGAGRNWPGGQDNLKLVGSVIEQQGWVDAEDKQAAIEAAVNYLRENGMLVPNPEVETRTRISGAKSITEIQDAIGYGRSTSIIGR